MGSPASASTATDLVQIAKGYEASHQEEIALRRYMDALDLDPLCAEAYLGLGSLRARRGDLREAERVYTVALQHIPSHHEARLARAETQHLPALIKEARTMVRALVILVGPADPAAAPADDSPLRRTLATFARRG
jgi:tetratricopeptide (TPR) repeat protein